MIRAFLVVAGLLMAVTGQTPFDLTGLHVSSNPLTELTLCVLALVAALASTQD